MNLAQMRTLLPLIEAAVQSGPPAYSNPTITEGTPVLNNLAPFSITVAHRRGFTWALNYRGDVIHSYEEYVR